MKTFVVRPLIKNQFIQIAVLLLTVLILGVVGYSTIEGWGFLDSLYMTVITFSSIGYNEVHPLDDQGRIFTIVLIIMGVVAVGYSARIMGQMILEGQLRRFFGRRAMKKNIQKMTNHYIVCGFGRVGRTVCEELAKNRVDFVAIEKDPLLLEEMEKADFTFISGNCDDDDILRAAGIERADGLINTLANEADAVYVTLSARQLNPRLFIMARADNPNVEGKLLKAGATRVISPHISAGQRMAQTTIKPNVVDFMTLASGGASGGLKIVEIILKDNSALVGSNLKDSGIRSQYGVTVIGARKKKGEMIYNPPPEFQIEGGDTLILMGTFAQLEKLEQNAGV
jgi:voltage-gated potassium channel